MRRKYIRIALTHEDYEKLREAKAIAEAGFRVDMSDSFFVLSLVRQALKL